LWEAIQGAKCPRFVEGTPAIGSLRSWECEREGRVRNGLPGAQVSFALTRGGTFLSKPWLLSSASEEGSGMRCCSALGWGRVG